MQCANCRRFVEDTERYCQGCGHALGDVVPGRSSGGSLEVTQERQWAMGAHLSGLCGMVIPFGNIVAPLVIWQIKKNESDFIAEEAKEALNFQIAVSIYVVAASILMIVGIGLILLPVIGIGSVVLMVLAAIKANEGQAYRYPGIFRLIK